MPTSPRRVEIPLDEADYQKLVTLAEADFRRPSQMGQVLLHTALNPPEPKPRPSRAKRDNGQVQGVLDQMAADAAEVTP